MPKHVILIRVLSLVILNVPVIHACHCNNSVDDKDWINSLHRTEVSCTTNQCELLTWSIFVQFITPFALNSLWYRSLKILFVGGKEKGILKSWCGKIGGIPSTSFIPHGNGPNTCHVIFNNSSVLESAVLSICITLQYMIYIIWNVFILSLTRWHVQHTL